MHVWRLRLRPDSAAERQAWNVLDADERAAAQRLQRDSDREVQVRGRAFVRSALGDYLDIPAREVTIVAGEHGKPVVGDIVTTGGLSFSLSHSGDWALMAVATNREVGVDIERIDDALFWRDIAERFFAPVEVHAIEQLADGARRPAFFDCWVRKEAYLKGLGTGFQRTTTNFSVPVDGAGGAVVDGGSTSSGEAEAWYVHRLDVEAGYAAALAVRGGATVTMRSWSEEPPGAAAAPRATGATPRHD